MKPTLTLFTALLLAPLAALHAADAPTSKPAMSDVFVAGQDGVHTYRIPAMVLSPSGAVLVFCEARKEGIRDASPTNMVLKRSLDGGRTWLPMQTLVRGEGTDALMNPVAVVDRTASTIFLLCCNTNRKTRGEHRRHLLLTSRDDGATWSAPVDIGGKIAGYDDTFVPGPGCGIQTRSGRLVMPGYTSPEKIDGKDEHGFRSRVIYSDDGGKTWRMGQPVDNHTNESQVVELADGRLMLNMRQGTGQSCRAVAISKDGGERWGPVSWDRALNECPCQASILRHSSADMDGRSIIVFANPDNAGERFGVVERTKMTVRLSFDEAQTWPVKKLIHAGPSSYSGLVRFPGGDVGLVFEGGEKHRREWIRFARLPLAWLTDGKDLRASSHADRHLKVVRAYADCILKHGRDSCGKQRSPLFAEALDRRTLKLLEGDALLEAGALKFEAWGIRPHDRMLGGANPMHCENLYQVIYALTGITRDRRYAAEADRSLKFFFEHCQSPATGLFYWGEHAGWDFRSDAPLAGQINCNVHEFYRPWALWDRSWKLAPAACLKFARGLWEHQIADHETGDYSRHAAIDKHGPGTGAPYPRHGGCYVETWAFAYKKTRDAVFLKAIETVVDGLERMRRGGGMIAGGHIKSKAGYVARDAGLAVSLWEASASLPDALAAKLREIARANDVPASVGTSVKTKSSNLWSDGYGGVGGQIASPANLLMLRYRQSQPERYRERILAVADVYLAEPVNQSFPLHPGTFGKVIWLMLNAHELTGEARYLDRADDLARQAVELFLPDGCPLPKATHAHDHYEAVTNADTLMMSLLRLWAARQNPPRKLPLVYTDR